MFDFVSFIPRAIMQGIPLLFGSTGETLTEKSGNLNLGIAGIMYVGGISGVIGAFLYEQGAGGAAGMNLVAAFDGVDCTDALVRRMHDKKEAPTAAIQQ